MELYPTPSQSPFLNKDRLPIWKPRKRKSCPVRAISPPLDNIDRSFQRIISLDVYSIFNQNPAQLLDRKEFSETESEEEEPKKTSTCKLMPSFNMENEVGVNLEAYRKTEGAPNVSWKGINIGLISGAQPLTITSDMPEYEKLTAEEIRTCGTLRISPKQYIDIKRTMLTAVRSYGPFKKREAQTWFRIDVNKVCSCLYQICILYDWFKSLDWIPSTEDWTMPETCRRAERKKVKRR